MLNREVGFVLSNGHRQSSPAGPKSANRRHHSNIRLLRNGHYWLARGIRTVVEEAERHLLPLTSSCHPNSSSKTFASFKSGVSKPSVNQP